mmetsp:Transcript_111257/g.321705  ORF Transcript_111257/g.321705 Transcript_111257/m.321705 type:complete len:325 (+) Transcript_111257:199-1173(+)|eukprot:CAMPEP_0176070282 /NCGR_PEP_ID=MMETSP0120_2-20121206/35096_1 /TAXON_ID=160619 /ORGANISM="Kryptoperidinium foliaceum, Strain CCMP 1326" /LENGTH=324 /DNA_ID=CAMNT_0017403925 /DNA_START=197 /DNA_END=1171 /DNA_ORIENTATION=-
MKADLYHRISGFTFTIFLLSAGLCAGKSDKSNLLGKPHGRAQQLLAERSLLNTRGGQSSQDPYGNYAHYNNPASYTANDPEDGFDNYNAPSDISNADHLFQESVQERVDKWRQSQMEQSQQITPQQEMSPRDSQGRMKLLASVSKGSRAILFFLLMWRDIHLYELADQAFKGTFRLFVVTPLISLFIGNMAGVVASFTAAGHGSKKRMKAILNLDKLVEGLLLVYYFFRLTVLPSKYVPRELYVARTLHSVMFMVQLQAFTRLSWDENIVPNAAKGKAGNAGQQAYPGPQMASPVYGQNQNQNQYAVQQPTYVSNQDDRPGSFY